MHTIFPIKTFPHMFLTYEIEIKFREYFLGLTPASDPKLT